MEVGESTYAIFFADLLHVEPARLFWWHGPVQSGGQLEVALAHGAVVGRAQLLQQGHVGKGSIRDSRG